MGQSTKTLDERIDNALGRLGGTAAQAGFDIQAYGAAFHGSAREKARTVLEALAEPNCPFREGTPVFLTVGGADGEEIEFLLRNSNCNVGILLEVNRSLADAARARNSSLGSKRIEIVEGPAQDMIGDAVDQAYRLVKAGDGNFVAVTCHAVIHELFDRGNDFDPIGFFARIFSDREVPVWFSYREPGRPEKWPEEVLLSANCSLQSLRNLSLAIAQRHPNLASLRPKPDIVGDSIRMNAVLAMEVLAKLFYVDDLAYEIEERSTAVDHAQLVNALHIAIGAEARRDGRCEVSSVSKPTESFSKYWADNGVRIFGISRELTQYELPVPESHTRVIAWRRSLPNSPPPTADDELEVPDVFVASRTALAQRDLSLLGACLANSGRYWIESPVRADALQLFEDIRLQVDPGEMAFVMARFLGALPPLFNNTLDPNEFSEDAERSAAKHGLGLLIRAERMELARKAHHLEAAVDLANSLVPTVRTLSPQSPLERYQAATVMFLLANLLREGGRYREALWYVQRAQDTYSQGIPSHDTELAHCEYASLACRAMLGDATLLGTSPHRAIQHKFADALIEISFAHGAWLLSDTERALGFATNAADRFRAINYDRYARRADLTHQLLSVWKALEQGAPLDLEHLPGEIGAAVATLTGVGGELAGLLRELEQQRPGRALGLLQFATWNRKVLDQAVDIGIPTFIDVAESGWRLRAGITVGSLREAEMLLRTEMGVGLGQRVPLLP